jgi:hypothetical protein
MSLVREIKEALVVALEPIRATIEDVQIYPYFLNNPTPPAIDIYAGNPFMGSGPDMFFTIRARVSVADSDAGQQLLDEFLDPEGPTSIRAALIADQSLGGVVDSLSIAETDSGISGLTEFVEDAAVRGELLGSTWLIRVLT